MAKRSIGHVKKLAEGKYLLRLSAGFDDYGKRVQPSKTVYCKNDREAEAALMEFYKERDKIISDRTQEGPDTLAQMYKEWVDNHVSKKAIQTQSFYESLWKNYVKDKGKIKLKSILPKHIFEIIDNVDGDRSKQAVFKMLKAMLNKGVKWGYISENPCNRIDAPQYQSEEKRGLTKDEIDLVMAELPNHELKYQAAVMLAMMCGLRLQEVVGLKWSNINFDNDMLNIKQAAISEKGKGTVEGKTKTKKSVRALRLPSAAKVLLKRMQKAQAERRLKLGDKWIDEGWIFTQWNGKLLNLSTVSKWWHDFAKELKIEGVTFHGLRHTAATYLITSGVDIITAAGILGHAKPSTTMNIYGHLIEDTKINAMADLEKTFTSKPKKRAKKSKLVQ